MLMFSSAISKKLCQLATPHCKLRRRTANAASTLFVVAIAILPAGSAVAQSSTTAQARATAYHRAASYLRTAGSSGWAGEPAQAILLAEAILADPLAAGPRETSLLASLDLHSVDARARRVLALAPLGIDVTADTALLRKHLAIARPDLLALDLSTRQNTTSWYGEVGTRVPAVLENALALRALRAAGINAGVDVDNAILDLLEFKYPIKIPNPADPTGSYFLAMAWSMKRFPLLGAPSGTLADLISQMPLIWTQLEYPGDFLTSAQAILALRPYADESWQATVSVDPALNCDPAVPLESQVFCIQPNISLVVQSATNMFLLLHDDEDAPYLAHQILILVDLIQAEADPGQSGWLPWLDAKTASLLSPAANLQSAANGSFQDSAYATALAAQALRALSSVPGFGFDTDGDGILDGPDPDADGDGYADLGESCGSCAPGVFDAFSFDSTEWSDLDVDGIGDNTDSDADGDGIADASEPGALAWNPIEFLDTDNDTIGDVFDDDDDNDSKPDVAELIDGTDPLNWDTDNDLLADVSDVCPTIPWTDLGNGSFDGVDADGDGICTPIDACDDDPADFVDTDLDSVCDGADDDDDGDGFSDAIELAWGSDPRNADSLPEDIASTHPAADFDADGLSNSEEMLVYGTSPYLADSDSDGVPDGAEILADPATSPTNPLESPPAVLATFGAAGHGGSPAIQSSSVRATVTLGQGTPIAEAGEPQTVSAGFEAVSLAGFQPLSVLAQDGDRDGLVGLEENLQSTSLFDVDTDGDGFTDGTDGFVALADFPGGWDLDGDMTADGELDHGTDPLDPADRPGKLGDVAPLGNPDGVVNAADAHVALRLATDPGLLAGLTGQNQAIAEQAADVSPEVPDGAVKADDALAILKQINAAPQ